MELHNPDNWVTDDSHPKKAGTYFVATLEGSTVAVSLLAYSKKTYWGRRDVVAFFPVPAPAFAGLGEALLKKHDDEIKNATHIVIVGDDGEPLKSNG